MIEASHPRLSVVRQCALLSLPRSSFYAPLPATGESEENRVLMRWLDEQYTKTPFYGSPKMTFLLRQAGYSVNHKRVERLMREMGLRAIAPGKATSTPAPGHVLYPYLLRGVRVENVDQVWSSDFTYIRLRHGFVFLVAVIDWFSRFVLSWELSTTQDADFCVRALEAALGQGTPGIFNTDQGSQFTSEAFTSRLKNADIRISMEGLRTVEQPFAIGWKGAGIGQYLCRTLMADGQVRGGVSSRLRNGQRSTGGAKPLPEILQRGAYPPIAPVQNPGRGLPNRTTKTGGEFAHRKLA